MNLLRSGFCWHMPVFVDTFSAYIIILYLLHLIWFTWLKEISVHNKPWIKKKSKNDLSSDPKSDNNSMWFAPPRLGYRLLQLSPKRLFNNVIGLKRYRLCNAAQCLKSQQFGTRFCEQRLRQNFIFSGFYAWSGFRIYLLSSLSGPFDTEA